MRSAIRTNLPPKTRASRTARSNRRDATFPAVDRGAKGDPVFGAPGVNAKRLNGRRSAAEPYAYKSWPRELEDPRDDEFDPGHTMSPQRPADGDDGGNRGAQFRGWRDAGGAARIRAQLLFAHLQRRRRRRCRGRRLGADDGSADLRRGRQTELCRAHRPERQRAPDALPCGGDLFRSPAANPKTGRPR